MVLRKRNPSIMKIRLFISTIFLFASFCSFAQLDNASYDFNEIKDQIEDILSNLEEDGDFEDNSVLDILEDYFNNPLDINKVSAEELKQLRFLSDVQINDIIDYRRTSGDFIALYELQAVPSLNENDIRILLPFVRIKGGVDDYNVPLREMLSKGKNEIYLRWERFLETKKGYTPLEEGEEASRYLGDPNKILIRYRHQYETTVSYGFLLEKDQGEQFFKGENKRNVGFDFGTVHFFLKDYNKYIKGLALGDFAVNMGQGLIMFDGFGGGKGAYVMDLKKLGRSLRPYTSAGEVLYKRGGGINLEFGENFEVMAFASYRKRDANIVDVNEIEDFDGNIEDIIVSLDEGVSSLQGSGFHRTEGELLDKNSIQHLSTGGTIKYKGKNWHIAANGLIDKLNTNLQRTIRPYNQFAFNGDMLKSASLDYSVVVSNFNFFGETAMSDNGGIATLNGLIMGLDRRVSLSLLHRHYQKNYQVLFSNAFSETSRNNINNETGLYMGLEIKPNKSWILSGYFDSWKHSWLRSTSDAPSKGKEYLARITYKQKRRMQVYVQFMQEFKERNAPDNETATDYLVDTRKTRLRLHIENDITKSLRLRSRAEMSLFDNGVAPTTSGYMLLQDVIFKSMGFPLAITARYAIFDIQDSNNRIYAFENDILNSFSIPGYSNRGTRFYIKLRYTGIRNMSLEFRFAQTYYSNQDSFGSGLEEINKPRRSELKAQMKYKF